MPLYATLLKKLIYYLAYRSMCLNFLTKNIFFVFFCKTQILCLN